MPSELAMETVQAGTPHGTAAPPPPSVPEAADAVAAARRRGEAAPATPAAIEPGLALRPEAAMAQGSATPTPAQASRAELRTSLAAAAPPATARMSLTVDPMAAIAERAASRDDALRWTRDGRRYGHGDAQLAWLDALRSAAAGRWQRAGAGLADGNSVQFLDGARAIAEWRLQDGRVQLIEPAGIWEAPLGDADAARLRALGDAW
jgi:hypothetical protein